MLGIWEADRQAAEVDDRAQATACDHNVARLQVAVQPHVGPGRCREPERLGPEAAKSYGVNVGVEVADPRQALGNPVVVRLQQPASIPGQAFTVVDGWHIDRVKLGHEPARSRP